MTAGDILKQPVLTRESIVHLPSDTCQPPPLKERVEC